MATPTIASMSHEMAREAVDQAKRNYDDAFRRLKVVEGELTFAARKLREARAALGQSEDLSEYRRLAPAGLALDPRD